MPTTKLKYYWHIHHDTLCEYTYDIKERIAFIKEAKPKSEVRERLRLMTPVQHPDKLPLRFRRAASACVKADAACIKATAARDKALNVSTLAYKKADAACGQALATYIKADAAYVKALTTYAAQLEELHREEHPRCPWNGKTIFPK